MSTIVYERTEEQIEIDEEILARVKNGIALLEREFGPNWVDKINLDWLNLANGASCVCGQVFREEAADDYTYYDSGYAYARAKFFPGSFGEQYGFHYATQDRYRKSTPEERAEGWLELKRTWQHVLTPMVSRGEA